MTDGTTTTYSTLVISTNCEDDRPFQSQESSEFVPRGNRRFFFGIATQRLCQVLRTPEKSPENKSTGNERRRTHPDYLLHTHRVILISKSPSSQHHFSSQRPSSGEVRVDRGGGWDSGRMGELLRRRVKGVDVYLLLFPRMDGTWNVPGIPVGYSATNISLILSRTDVSFTMVWTISLFLIRM